MTRLSLSQIFTRPDVLAGLFVLLLSYLTYFQNYNYPPALFWDENYHIASAQKYLNGVYFMEPHPPLGKLLIAAGEKIFDANPGKDNEFIGTDYARELPEGFSFDGYRFFPSLLGWLTAPVLFLVFLLLARNPHIAALLSFFYIFDNALIVHSRGAMLDSTLLFFVALTLLGYFLVREFREGKLKLLLLSAALFGAAFGGVMTTKANGLILILLIPFVAWEMRRHAERFLKTLGVGALAFAVVYLGVWYIHFSLGTTVNKDLADNGFYQASAQYQQILKTKQNRSLQAFPIMLRDSLKFTRHYANGVPRLDLCKADENGSPFFTWPLGGRSINYRWETPEGRFYRYLYLQVNPVIWWASFAAVLLGAALLVASVIPPMRPLKYRFILTVFLTLYVCYMIAIAQLDRVMYLYHYFPPLLFSFVIAGIVFLEIEGLWVWKFTDQGRKVGLLIFGLLTFFAFQFYRPLTYYQPLSDEQFKRRAIFPMWELTCVKCDKVSIMAQPCK